MSCVKPSASERACRAALAAALTALPCLMAAAAPDPHPHRATQSHSPRQPEPFAQACAQAYPPVIQPTEMPALAASYRVTWTARGQAPQQQIWRLRRSATELVWDKGTAQSDIWQRDAGGIRLARVLHREQAVVVYSAGELRTLALDIDWQGLARLLTDADLAQLSRAPAANRPKAGLLACRGQLSGEQVALLWDSAHQLPVRLQRRHAAGQVLFERTALHKAAPTDWPAPDASTAGYRQIDSADLGDLADDPAARQAQRLDTRMGWRMPAQH